MRGWIYDRALTSLTSGWYRAVLERVPPGARVLDVGIGTAGALLDNAALVRARDLRVVGVDIDAAYVARARRRVAAAGLDDRITVLHEPIEAHAGGPYDAIYFSGSFMLLDAPDEVLVHAAPLLAPDGQVFFTQTFERARRPLLERLKPLLVRLTSVDFGRVTYEGEFVDTLRRGGLTVEDQVVLGSRLGRESRMVIARPAARAVGGAG